MHFNTMKQWLLSKFLIILRKSCEKIHFNILTTPLVFVVQKIGSIHYCVIDDFIASRKTFHSNAHQLSNRTSEYALLPT